MANKRGAKLLNSVIHRRQISYMVHNIKCPKTKYAIIEELYFLEGLDGNCVKRGLYTIPIFCFLDTSVMA